MIRLFYSLLLLAAPIAASAQTAPANAPAASSAPVDTVAQQSEKYALYHPGTLRLLNGTEIKGYFPAPEMYPGIDFPFVYYLSSPSHKPKPQKQNAKIADIVSMTAGTHYFETMRIGDKKAKILAERFVEGPVELFMQVEPESIPLPIPVAGAFLHTAIPYKNSHFFIRLDGQLKEVRRDIFERQISTYLKACPELAQKVARGEQNYRYRDMIRIVNEYNAFISSNKPTGSL
jgi:hypothetical protein